MEAPCSHGSTVEVVDRQTVRYSGGALSASVVVDFAAITGLYPDSLRALAADGHPIAPDAALREHLLARTESGLACLGVHTERCRRSPEAPMERDAPVLPLAARFRRRTYLDTMSRSPSATSTPPARRSSHSPALPCRASHWPMAPAK